MFEAFDHTERRFVEYHGAGLVAQLFETFGPSLLLRKETFETESVARESALHDRRNESRGSGQRLDLDAGLDACAHQQESRIGYARGAGIGYQSDGMSFAYGLGQRGGRGVLVELVVRVEPLFDAQMFEQERGRARILGEDEVGILQHLYCAERDVVEIAYGRGYDVELGHSITTIFVPEAAS